MHIQFFVSIRNTDRYRYLYVFAFVYSFQLKRVTFSCRKLLYSLVHSFIYSSTWQRFFVWRLGFCAMLERYWFHPQSRNSPPLHTLLSAAQQLSIIITHFVFLAFIIAIWLPHCSSTSSCASVCVRFPGVFSFSLSFRLGRSVMKNYVG